MSTSTLLSFATSSLLMSTGIHCLIQDLLSLLFLNCSFSPSLFLYFSFLSVARSSAFLCSSNVFSNSDNFYSHPNFLLSLFTSSLFLYFLMVSDAFAFFLHFISFVFSRFLSLASLLVFSLSLSLSLSLFLSPSLSLSSFLGWFLTSLSVFNLIFPFLPLRSFLNDLQVFSALFSFSSFLFPQFFRVFFIHYFIFSLPLAFFLTLVSLFFFSAFNLILFSGFEFFVFLNLFAVRLREGEREKSKKL